MNPVNDLDALAIRFGTDKATQPVGRLAPKGYTVAYSRYLSALRDRPIRLLEIGIAHGASLKMWEAYFPNAGIYGIDVNAACRQYQTERTRVFIGSQTDRKFLLQVMEEIGSPLDVVIDDGGHRMEQHWISLTTLFPYLSSGGFYVIEDLHTAYEARYGGGYLAKESTIEFLKGLVDQINGGAPFVKARRTLWERLRGRLTPDDSQLPTGIPTGLERLESVHFYKSLAFLLAK